jgi:hypothetical protein
VTAGGLVLLAARRRQPELLPYAALQGAAGLLGAALELAALLRDPAARGSRLSAHGVPTPERCR